MRREFHAGREVAGLDAQLSDGELDLLAAVEVDVELVNVPADETAGRKSGRFRPDPSRKNTADQQRCCGAPSGFRTPDPLIKSQLLYQLS